MSRASINPRCPYCHVRHSTSTTWRCKERDESDDVGDTPIPPEATSDSVSRVQAVEAAEDRAEQAAFEVARERGQ